MNDPNHALFTIARRAQYLRWRRNAGIPRTRLDSSAAASAGIAAHRAGGFAMAELSPAAQAIKDAFLCDCEISLEAGIAAALRAAADQGENLYDPHEGKVVVVRVDQLRAFAAELDPTEPHG